MSRGNSSGIRAPTVIRELKKMLPRLRYVSQRALKNLNPAQVEVEIHQAGEALEEVSQN